MDCPQPPFILATAVFWLATTLIVIGVGYLLARGALEPVARSLHPIPFHAVKTEEFKLRASCETPRSRCSDSDVPGRSPYWGYTSSFSMSRPYPRSSHPWSSLTRRSGAQPLPADFTGRVPSQRPKTAALAHFDPGDPRYLFQPPPPHFVLFLAVLDRRTSP